MEWNWWRPPSIEQRLPEYIKEFSSNCSAAGRTFPVETPPIPSNFPDCFFLLSWVEALTGALEGAAFAAVGTQQQK